MVNCLPENKMSWRLHMIKTKIKILRGILNFNLQVRTENPVHARNIFCRVPSFHFLEIKIATYESALTQKIEQ